MAIIYNRILAFPEILTHATPWKNPEEMMLRELNPRKLKFCGILPTGGV